jgi:hypothetical protein
VRKSARVDTERHWEWIKSTFSLATTRRMSCSSQMWQSTPSATARSVVNLTLSKTSLQIPCSLMVRYL